VVAVVVHPLVEQPVQVVAVQVQRLELQVAMAQQIQAVVAVRLTVQPLVVTVVQVLLFLNILIHLQQRLAAELLNQPQRQRAVLR
jgi:hypothetical protein